MFGAFLGDAIGSVYEFNNLRSKDFPLLTPRNYMTDDSFMTLAVIETLVKNKDNLNDIDRIEKDVVESYVKYFKKYPYGGYGNSFYYWCYRPSHSPYNSYGNGAGMRVSPVGWISSSEEQVKTLSRAVTEVSHNHPEGIKGAECIAMCIYHLRHGKDKDFIRDLVINNYYPRLKELEYDEVVKNNKFDETCQGSIPEAIYCFLISTSFEDCARTAVSIGGDSDTIACMACALAEPYYKHIDEELISRIKVLMDEEELELLEKFDEIINY